MDKLNRDIQSTVAYFAIRSIPVKYILPTGAVILGFELYDYHMYASIIYYMIIVIRLHYIFFT